jgi:hypothetical protein
MSPDEIMRVTRILATFELRVTARYLREAREKRGDGPSLSAWFYLGRAAESWEQRKVLEADLRWLRERDERRDRMDRRAELDAAVVIHLHRGRQ